jgi:hypothetical protein
MLRDGGNNKILKAWAKIPDNRQSCSTYKMELIIQLYSCSHQITERNKQLKNKFLLLI